LLSGFPRRLAKGATLPARTAEHRSVGRVAN